MNATNSLIVYLKICKKSQFFDTVVNSKNQLMPQQICFDLNYGHVEKYHAVVEFDVRRIAKAVRRQI
jgi:hypothetical protein